jgi:hypothetical protein
MIAMTRVPGSASSVGGIGPPAGEPFPTAPVDLVCIVGHGEARSLPRATIPATRKFDPALIVVGSRPRTAGGRFFASLYVVLPVAGPSMVARIGFSATTSRESRQGRKAAAAATMSGAGARAGAGCLPMRMARVLSVGVPLKKWGLAPA